MSAKKQFSIIILITGLMVSGIVLGEDPPKGDGAGETTFSSGAGLGWQEQTKRVSVLVTDGMRLTTGLGITLTGPSWTIGVSSNFNIIECCRPTTLKQSWCNFNADDLKCKG